MTVIDVVCIATEEESKECIDSYIAFKTKLETNSNQSCTIMIHDVGRINQTQQRGSNKLKDKLEKKLKTCPVILVVCSPDLKSYLDKGTPSSNKLMAKDERKVLLKSLRDHKEKVIPVYLDTNFVSCLPDILAGVDLVDGIKDMGTLVEVKIPAKLK